MDPGAVVAIIVVTLGSLLGIWGASLVVRALASRGSRFSLRWRRRVPRPLHITPPTLSRVQFWFGMIAGPVFVAAGGALAIFVLRDVLLSRDENPLFAIGALLLLMLGAGTLLVGYRWDPAEGRRRCTKCWYDYSGLRDDAACPECGRMLRNARALLRTRRSPAMMRLGAVIVLAAWGAYIAPRAIQTNGRSLVPTTVLIGGFELLPERVLVVSGWSGDDTLQDRLWNDQVTDRQRRWLYKRSTRLLETSDDPRVCGLAARFLNLSRQFSTPFPPDLHELDLDAAGANLLRVMFADTSGFAEAGFEEAGMLSAGPKTTRVVEEHADELLARYKGPLPTAARTVYGRLLARLAPLTPEAYKAVAEVAFDPTLVYQDHATACVVYGMLARRDPALGAQLERDFAGATGFDRETLATAIFASKVEPARVYGGGLWVSAARGIDDALLEAFASDDAAVRNGAIANASVGQLLYGVGFDSNTITPAIREVGRMFSDSRMSALQHSAMYGGPTVDDLSMLVAVAQDGSPQDLLVVGAMLKRVWMNASWVPLYDAVTERMKVPGLDPGSAGVLDGIESRMKEAIPNLR